MNQQEQNVPAERVQSSPGLEPMQDERLLSRMQQALAGKLPVYFGAVPIGQIVPFDLDYRPDLHPIGAQAIDSLMAKWKEGHFRPLLVYQRGAWFVVADDYIALFASLTGRPDYLPCFILGKPDHPQVKDVQGPLSPEDVQKAMGFAS